MRDPKAERRCPREEGEASAAGPWRMNDDAADADEDADEDKMKTKMVMTIEIEIRMRKK